MKNPLTAPHTVFQVELSAFRVASQYGAIQSRNLRNSSVIAAHAFLPVSVWVKNHARAATTARMAVTIRMYGFAFETTLKAACAFFALSTAFFMDLRPVTHFRMLPACLIASIACVAL